MLRIITDSSSSITQEEARQLGIDVLPLRISFKDKEYSDTIDINSNRLFSLMEEKGNENVFPKTSLPFMDKTQDLVEGYTKIGDEVLIITISSKLSSTFSMMHAMFATNDKVNVYDSKSAVGGIRLLVLEALKNKDKNIEEIIAALDALSSRIVILALPSTLDFLLRGGRLKKSAWMLGTLLKLLPVISFKEGQLVSLTKVIGNNKGIAYISKCLSENKPDKSFPVIGSFTKEKGNLDKLEKKLKEVNGIGFDIVEDMSASIAAHWGPNAFGLIYAKAK